MSRLALAALSVFCVSACQRELPGALSEARTRPTLPAARPLPGPTAHYELSAALDAERHEIRSRAFVHWTNRSERSVSEIYLHLYLNAFREGSAFLTGPRGRSGLLGGRFGGITIESLESARYPGVDLWSERAAAAGSPPGDETDVVVRLPAPIEPGEALSLTCSFTAVLPEIVERTGYRGDYHLIGQWFPKLARLEPDGTWAHYWFHPFAEFYADFDDYVVTLDVPHGYVVGSTGSIEPTPGAAPGRARYRAVARRVLDFAWTAWPGFLEEKRRIDGTRVRLLVPSDSAETRRAHWDTLRHALRFYGEEFGTYPYEDLTVVVPPAGAERSGGMEYPGFITTGQDELGSRLGVHGTELLVSHELGHQWFQSTVANDEVRFPFLDEGLTSFVEQRYLERRFGSAGLADVFGLRLSRLAGGRIAAFHGRKKPEAVSQPASAFSSFGALGREVYARTPLILETLARVYGRGSIDAAMAHYARQFRGAHPKPEDFYEILSAFVDQVQPGSDSLPLVRSLFEEAGTFNLRIAALEPNELRIERDGNLALPFEAQVSFGDGSVRRFTSDGRERSIRLPFEHPSRAVSAIVDPERKLLLDENWLDNRIWAQSTQKGRPAAPHENTPPRTQTLLVLALEALSQLLGP